MYLNILKKDLKRKRAMNIILLLFIILATMFVASSVNNIINVTTALDSYFEMANVPGYFAAVMNKNLTVDIDETVNMANAVDSYATENVLLLQSSNFIYEDKDTVAEGTNLVQSGSSSGMNYFLSDGSTLETVRQGEFYMAKDQADALGIDVGGKLTIKLNGVSREFVLADKIKDALFGSKQVSITRYIISQEDFESFLSAENTEKYYGGRLVYIYSYDMETALPQIKPLIGSSLFTMDRTLMKFSYIFDMIVVGFLLVVSIFLIVIAFVVLRFTISFTLSEEFREIGVMKAIGDRKTICGSKNTEHKAYHVVNAFVAENQITLGKIEVGKKSNEITAVPELLNLIDIEEAIVTADAMSCQKKIVEKIMEKKADYTIGLKQNQPALYKNTQDYMDEFSSGLPVIRICEKGHGKINNHRKRHNL